MKETSLHVKGTFYFHAGPSNVYKGPVTKNFHPLIWGVSQERFTASMFIPHQDIKIGFHGEVDVYIFNPNNLDVEVFEGGVLIVGSVIEKLGHLKVKEIVK